MKNIIPPVVHGRKQKFICLLLIQLVTSGCLFASAANHQIRSIDEVIVRMGWTDTPIEEAFNQIESQTGFNFVYTNKELHRSQKITVDKKQQTLYDVLVAISSQAQLEFKQVNHNIHVKKAARNTEAPVVIANEEVDISVRGTVQDSSGEPIPGATVSVQGTAIGTATDLDGAYSLVVPDGSTLVFSFIGFESQTVTVGSQTVIDITLTEDMASLEEVVVVGYGVQKKTTLTGSVSALKGDDITQLPVPNISQSLAGRVSGVSMRPNGGQPGHDDPDIHIRGIATTGNSRPLVVVDGIRRDNIRQVDPSSIETITILKDAAAVAPYGIGGANGVVLITTKKGQSGKARVSINTSLGYQNPTYLPDMLSAKDYMALQNEAYLHQTPGGTNLPNNPETVANYDALHQEDPWRYPDSNFLDIFNTNVPVQNHNVQVSGGNEFVTYHAGVGYFDQKGIFDPVNYRRYNYNLSLEVAATNTTRIGLSMLASIERTNDVDADEETSGHLFRSFYKFLPNQSLIFPEGDKWGESSANTPVGVLRSPGYRKTDGNTQLATFFVEQQIIDGLSVRGVFSYDPNYRKVKLWHVPFVYHKIDLSEQPYTYTEAISLQEGAGRPFRWLGHEEYSMVNYTYQGYVNYQKTFGDHSVTALGVVEVRETASSELTTRRNNFAIGIDELSFGSSDKLDYDNSGISSTGTEIGYVYRFGYTYKDKYILEAAGRYDGHYYFAPGARWGYFPAFSGAWRISEENFMKSNLWLDELKIRGSWGKAGMLAGDPFQYQAGYDLRGNAYAFGNGTLVQGSRVPREANPNITWEVSTKSNVGVDLSLWSGKLNMEVDYFMENRNGMLLAPQVTLPVEYGLSLSQENKGRMKGKGVEIALGTQQRYANGLDFSIQGNFTYATNSMQEVFETDAERANPNRTKVGRPYETPYGYKSDGLFQLSDDINGDGVVNAEDGYNVVQFGDLHPGDIRYVDLSGPNGIPDGLIDDHDLTVIGKPYYPLMTFGLTSTFSWKGFDLGLFFQGSGQSSINVRQFMTVPFENNGSNTGYEYMDNRWTADNPNGKYPRSTPAPYANNTKDSDFWRINSSYLRLKTLNLGYTLPASLTQKLKLSSVRVYGIAQNVFTISKINHIDPEMGYTHRETAYPVMRATTLGLDISF
jgi:TonB-linked SusC/RagA family outer membrane protein